MPIGMWEEAKRTHMPLIMAAGSKNKRKRGMRDTGNERDKGMAAAAHCDVFFVHVFVISYKLL